MTTEKSMRERMLAGELYIADDPELARELERAQSLLQRFNEAYAADVRQAILTDLLGAFGEGSGIRPPFYCD